MKGLNIVTILIVIIGGFLILNGVYKLGYKIGKHSMIVNPKGAVTDLQKELTDFANKQREFYKKTHNEY